MRHGNKGLVQCPHLVIFAVLLMTLSGLIDGCTFDSALQGEWYSNSRGLLTINSTHIGPLDMNVAGVDQFLECFEKDTQNNLYVFRTFSSGSLYMDTCFEMTQVTSASYKMLSVTSANTNLANNPRVLLHTANPTDRKKSCDVTPSSTVAGTYEFIVKKGSESTAKKDCPTAMQFISSYQINDGSTALCPSAGHLELCNDIKGVLKFNNSQCSSTKKYMYSDSGDAQCLYDETKSSKNFLNVFNTDPNANKSTNLFTCLVYESNGTLVTMSQVPGVCLSNQAAATVPAGGAVIKLTKTGECVAPTQAPNSAGVIHTGVLHFTLWLIPIITLTAWL